MSMHLFDHIRFGTVDFSLLSAGIWVLVALALTFDFLNGFHDAANSVATIVSTRVLTPYTAVIWAAFFNFVAFIIFPLNVAGMMGKGIIDPLIVDNAFVAATLIAACIWNLITWYWGLPTSSSHALIGGMIGAALVTKGPSALLGAGIGKTVLFIFLAPLIGMAIGLLIAWTVTWLFRRNTPRRVDRVFRWGQLLSAAWFSLGHGGNDAQKTMGIIVLLMASSLGWQHFKMPPESATRDQSSLSTHYSPLTKTHPEGSAASLAETTAPDDRTNVPAKVWVPTEIVLACHLAMGLGTLFGGWRIVKTMGQRIIRLRPIDGFCAEGGAATTLVMTIFYGIPVSTTHTITGSIVGVGALKRLSAVRWGVAGQVVWAWILTIPGSLAIAACCLWVYRALVSG
jgi:inorganic phosphate transporter, PiT family